MENKILTPQEWYKIKNGSHPRVLDFCNYYPELQVEYYAQYYADALHRWIPVEEGLPEIPCQLLLQWIDLSINHIHFYPNQKDAILSVGIIQYFILPEPLTKTE